LERIVGSRIEDCFVAEDAPALRELLRMVGRRYSELRVATDDGTLVPVYLSFEDLVIDGTKCLSLIVSDLSERKQMEAELARHRDHLEALVKERTGELEAANQRLEAEIAERRRADEELRRNREWLRVTLNSIGDGVVACDIRRRITFINPVAAALTGWTSEEALGRPLETVFRRLSIKRQAHPRSTS
jgi:PAS domain-containing protein